MSLRDKQTEFVWMVADFLQWCRGQGYELTFGECYRTPEQAQWNADHGLGIAHSLHTERLAIDLNLFVGGELQETVEAYQPLGVQWESMGGTWGGKFHSPDSDHFSLAWGGVE